jgi:TetR/AcrR family transcriptional repressor of nem operon
MSRTTLYPDTREHILAVGESLIQSRGFTALGLAELLTQAGVPKGSFYHYFASKEAFGVALLERYFENYDAVLGQQLAPRAAANSRTLLLEYFAGWIARAGSDGAKTHCLVVKLAGEVCDLSEPMRETLATGIGRLTRRIALCIKNAVEDGSLSVVENPEGLARTLYGAWIGCALLAKVSHDLESLEVLLEQTAAILASPAS